MLKCRARTGWVGLRWVWVASEHNNMANLQHNSFSSVTNTSCSLSSIILEKFRDVYLDEIINCRIDYERVVVLFCANCKKVLGDSLGVCGEYVDNVICLKVTEGVLVKADQKLALEGPFAYCIYNSLQCTVCSSALGRTLLATPPHLSAFRNVFLLQKDRINCYNIMNSRMVDGSAVSFQERSLSGELSELKRDLEAQMKRLECLKGFPGQRK